MLRTCTLVPAYDAAATIGRVVDEMRSVLDRPVIVVDDGSADATGRIAHARGALLVAHEENRGKGAALRSGMEYAARHGFQAVITADADGQHPASSARALLETEEPTALVLGVRDLERDGAPRSNRFGNGVSNLFVSLFAGRPLRDTQCGLRRYPVNEALALGTRADGYAFEAEVVLRAVAAGLPIVEVPIRVLYPPAHQNQTHFRRVRDPARIVATVVRTTVALKLGKWRA